MEITEDKKICCGHDCLSYEGECMMSGTEYKIWVCAYCGDYYKEEGGMLDDENIANALGLDVSSIKDFDTLDRVKLGDEITRIYNEWNG